MQGIIGILDGIQLGPELRLPEVLMSRDSLTCRMMNGIMLRSLSLERVLTLMKLKSL